MDKILTVTDVAEVLKVKEITVREMFRVKRLRAFKMGKAWRTTEEMLQEDIAALARGEMPAAAPDPAPKNEPPKALPAKRGRKPRVEKLEVDPDTITSPPKKEKVDDLQQLLF